MWAMCGRVSVGPLTRRAAATASSASRTARSPIAWTCGLEAERVDRGHGPPEAPPGRSGSAPFRRSAALPVEIRLEQRAR